jgi:hypothetical protein
MSDQNDMLKLLYDNNKRLKQTETREVPGNVPGFSQFYDTGTWVPTYLGGTTPGVTTYTTQVGAWVRVGALVVATATVQWSAATGTGDAQFSLPFTAVNTANKFYAVPVRTNLVTFANSAPIGQLINNTAYIILISPLTNAASGVTQIEAAGFIMYTASYFVA